MSDTEESAENIEQRSKLVSGSIVENTNSKEDKTDSKNAKLGNETTVQNDIKQNQLENVRKVLNGLQPENYSMKSRIHNNQRSLPNRPNGFLTNDDDIAMQLIDAEIENSGRSYKDIRRVDLSHRRIGYIYISLFKLENLVKLDLSNNNLYELPDFLDFKLLKELNISHNQFEYIPYCVERNFTKLSSLDVSHNKLKEYRRLKCRSHLKLLNLNDNLDLKLSEMFWLEEMPYLCQLNISKTDACFHLIQEGHVEKYFGLKNLRRLIMQSAYASYNNISHLQHLVHLEYLDFSNSKNSELSYNTFWDIPKCILSMSNSLTELNLSKVRLHDVSEDIGHLEHIQVLVLSYNFLFILPRNIAQLKCLRHLDISFNRLNELPENFYKLDSLVYCDLYDNELDEKCVQLLKQMSALKYLDVMQNFISQDYISSVLQENLRSQLDQSSNRRLYEPKMRHDEPEFEEDFSGCLNRDYGSDRSENSSPNFINMSLQDAHDELDTSSSWNEDDEEDSFGIPTYVPNEITSEPQPINLNLALEIFVKNSTPHPQLKNLIPSTSEPMLGPGRFPTVDVLAYVVHENQFDSD